MALLNQTKFFEEDAVILINKKKLECGLVVKSTTSAESSSDDSDDSAEHLMPGMVRVALYPTGRERVLCEKDLKLMERSLMPGDIVRRDNDSRQKGYVVNCDVICYLQVKYSDQILSRVDSRLLRDICTYGNESIYVELDGWLGRTTSKLHSKITLRLTNEEVCTVDADCLEDFEDLHDRKHRKEEESEFLFTDYYEGQRLKGPLKKLQFPKPTSGARNCEVTVVNVEVKSVRIKWLCSGLSPLHDSLPSPPVDVEGETLLRLRPIDPFVHATAQLGDTLYYTIQSTDELEVISTEYKTDVSRVLLARMLPFLDQKQADTRPREDGTDKHANGQTNKAKKIDLEPAVGQQVAVEVVLSETFVDLMWQDGSTEKRVSSRDLYPIYHLDDNEFFPGDFVIRADIDEICTDEYGVIASVCEADRTANVIWLNSSCNSNSWSAEQINISVYEIKDHPIYKFRPGAAVVRIQFDQKEEMQCCDDDVVGAVVELHSNGLLSVEWADKCVSEVYPHQLLLIANMHESDDDSSSEEDSDSDHVCTERDGEEDVDQSDGEESLEDMMKGFGSTLSTLLANFARVLESVKEIRGTGCMLSAEDFDSLVLPVVKAAQVFKQLMKLDDGLAEMMEQEDLLELFERSLLKARIYSKVNKSLLDVKSSLEYEQDDDRCSTSKFFSLTLQCLKELPTATCPNESDFIRDTLSIVNQLFQFTKVEPGERVTEELQEMSESICTTPTAQTECQPQILVRAIVDFNQTWSYSAQLEVVDHIDRLFSVLKDVTALIMEMYGTCGRDDKSDLESEFAVKNGCGEQNNVDIKPVTVDDKKAEKKLNEHAVKEIPDKQGCLMSTLNLDKCSQFQFDTECPSSHKFIHRCSQDLPPKFLSRFQNELKILSKDLPPGISVKAYEDRMDCLSALIVGPSGTPYEDGLFCFDMHLPADYPQKPPALYYYSYTSERLNPNLYSDGKVCVSLLGTWSGKQNEVWNPSSSNLLQVLVSIQGLILVKEPYFNEAGYDKQKDTPLGCENSKKYNEMVLVKLLTSMITMLDHPHESFGQYVTQHWTIVGERFVNRISELLQEDHLVDVHVDQSCGGTGRGATDKSCNKVCYPLLPLSKGCCRTLTKLLERFKKQLVVFGVKLPAPSLTGN